MSQFERVCVIGSCRVITPCSRWPYAVVYPHFLHTASQILQLTRFLQGTLSLPEHLLSLAIPHLACSAAPSPPHPDLSTCQAFVIEVCSLNNAVVTHRMGKVILFGPEEMARANLPEPIEITRDDGNSLTATLEELSLALGKRPIVFVSHNTSPGISNRYLIAWALRNVVDRHRNYAFLDPAMLIAKYGIDRCIVRDDAFRQGVHWTPFFVEKMAEAIDDRLQGLAANVARLAPA